MAGMIMSFIYLCSQRTRLLGTIFKTMIRTGQETEASIYVVKSLNYVYTLASVLVFLFQFIYVDKSFVMTGEFF